MTYAALDPELLAAMDNSRLSTAQRFMVQSVLQGIEPDSFLSRYASARPGLIPSVAQVAGSLRAHALHGQPNLFLLQRLGAAAAATLAEASKIGPPSDVISSLARIMADAEELTQDNQFAAMPLALRANQEMAPLSEYVWELFRYAWSRNPSTEADWRVLEFAADQVVCAVAAVNRDRRTLDLDLTRLFNQRQDSASAVYKVLLPAAREFHHACRVEGASSLESVQSLDPTARQLTGSPNTPLHWGAANHQLKRWLHNQGVSGSSTIVSVTVEAHDRASAAKLGRRTVVELLDQYMAGHRTANLTTAGSGFTSEVGSSKASEEVLPARSINNAYPLLSSWPTGLRPSLRMAHVARTVDSASVAAVIAWSAIEATGLEAERRDRLAQALALQGLRQQLMESYLTLSQDLRAQNAYWAGEVRMAGDKLSKIETSMARTPAQHQAQDTLVEKYNAVTATRDLAEAMVERLKPAEAALEQIAAACSADRHGHVRDLNSWIDLLMPPQPGESTSMGEARGALGGLISMVTPLTRRQVRRWEALLGDGPELARWIGACEVQMSRLLDAIYAARNRTIHAGETVAAGDIVLANGAVTLVDLVLEFLGNWYRHDGGQSGQVKTPKQVIELLASRQAAIVATLMQSRGPVTRLNADWVTSPATSSAWDRA